jgi:copper homeostasis protein
MEGKENLSQWHKRYGAKIGIMPGGGLRSGNIQDVIQTTGCHEFHSAAILDESETASALEVEQLAKIIHRS